MGYQIFFTDYQIRHLGNPFGLPEILLKIDPCHTSKILVTYTLLIHQRYSLLILYSYIKDTRYLYFTHTSKILATYTLLIHQIYSLLILYPYIKDTRLLILYSYIKDTRYLYFTHTSKILDYLYFTRTSKILVTYTLLIHQRI